MCASVAENAFRKLKIASAEFIEQIAQCASPKITVSIICVNCVFNGVSERVLSCDIIINQFNWKPSGRGEK